MIKKTILSLLTALFILAPAAPAAALGSTTFASFKSETCAGVTQVDSSNGCGSNASGKIGSIIGAIVDIISLIIGALSIIMILVAGFKFMTSGGDSSSVASAKSALMYALVGVVIAVLSQVIVRWVINRTLGAYR